MPSALARFRAAFPSALALHWPYALLVGLVFCFLWLNLFFLPLAPVNAGLDSSWCGVLIHSAALKLQFGKEVIFTYGPLAHLISFVYTGELFTVRLLWEFVSTTVFSAIFCATILFLPKLWRPVFFLFVLLFIWIDPICDALFFLVFTCVAAALFRSRNGGIAGPVLGGALFGVCSLIKFTYFVLGVFGIALLIVFYFCKRALPQAMALAGSFLAALLLSWTLAGQSLATFPAYVTSSMDISFGYKEAMGIPAASGWIVTAGAGALVLGLIQCGVVFVDSPRLATLSVVLFFGGAGFLSWTRAFVRADDHVLSFFAFFPVALLALWIPGKPGRTARRLGYGLNALVFATCLAGMVLQKPAAISGSIHDTLSRMLRTVTAVTEPGRPRKELEAALAQERAANDLPRVRAEVRGETIDVFGYEQGTALLNRLNYTPRPVFQGYSAYGPRLIAANTAFYTSARAPAYVLVKYQPIDQRFPTSEDAGVLLQLLFDYTPLFEERGYSLWKRARAPTVVRPALITTRSLLINEICEIPAQQNVWVELDLPKSFRGRLRSLLYKPPVAEIRTNDNEGHQRTHRLIPSMASAGFIINPLLDTPRAFLESAVGGRTGSVVSFLLDVPRESRRFFQRRATCRLFTLPSWTPPPRDAAARRTLYKVLFGDQPSEYKLTQDFDSASETLLDRNSAFAGFSDPNEAELIAGSQGVRILASGSDPYVLLPKFSLPEGQRAVLRIEIEAPADTGLQLFYLPPGQSRYGAHHFDRSISRGKNRMHFELTNAELGGPMRLDPGMVPGEYVITNFEVRLVPVETSPP